MEKVLKLSDLPKTGVFFTKALPPHRGHSRAIIGASARCQQLYVVISYHKYLEEKLCKEAGIDPIPLAKRKQWLSQEFIDMPHIKVLVLDESDLSEYPNGWEQWSEKMKETVPEKIDIFFVGEEEYVPKLRQYFDNVKVEIYDPKRISVNISATEIRKNIIKNWEYILGPSRPYFCKKFLISGTESSGKTTLTKGLAKIYNTSWSEEVGRYYAERFLGGDENYFTDEDFARISHQQVEQDFQAMRNANKICFFDTDATVTQYFSELYLGHQNKIVESYIQPEKYDIVFLLKPDVEWVDDGMRLNGEQEKREKLYNRLKTMYEYYGFNIIEVGGNYYDRMKTITEYIDDNILCLNEGENNE